MRFIRLLYAEAGDRRARLVLVALVPGVAMALVIAIVNTVSDYARSDGVQFHLLGFFVAACAVVLLSMNYTLNATTAIVARFLTRQRLLIAQQVRELDLTAFERIGRSRLYAAVGRDLQTIDETAPMVIVLVYFTMQLAVTAIYIGLLSLLAFTVTLFLLSAAVYFYRKSYVEAERLWKEATDAETAYRESLAHLLDGFKEIKLHRRRSDELFEQFIAVRAHIVEELRIQSGRGFNRGQGISDIFFFALMGAMVFAIPNYVSDAAVPGKIVTVIVFSSGAIQAIVRTLPMLARANLAVVSLDNLQNDLAAVVPGVARTDMPHGAVTSPPRIVARGLTYVYRDADGSPGFAIGPCDLEVEPGEILFIVGGNGSGKSTLIKLLTGLYTPADGTLSWDGRIAQQSDIAPYRELFSVIFSDFHLFDRLYGLDEVDSGEVSRRLEEMGLGDKLTFDRGRFSTTDLSTGQRKRLAMVVARLEDRPICIFDEWAADQDPQFRRFYYEELLPSLRAEGRSVVAITHDDRYFHLADRVIWMEEGRVARVQRKV